MARKGDKGEGVTKDGINGNAAAMMLVCCREKTYK